MIEFREVSKRCQKGNESVTILNNISLRINSGDFLAITGPCDEGKSTLLNILGGYYLPTTGSVIVNGETINKFSNFKMALFRFNNIGVLNKKLTRRNILSALANLKLRVKVMKNKMIMDILNELKIEGLFNRKLSEMSMGDKQRVAVANTIIKNPKIILVDEQVGQFDEEASEYIMKAFKKANQAGVTIIMATNNPVEVSKSKRIVRLIEGEVVSDVIKE